jgi:hypothetical protein
MPLYGACSLLLAAGLGRVIGDTQGRLAVLSSGWQSVREYRSELELPPPPPSARNVLFIVWDTVRAYNLSIYG